jgi:predicted O-linked N-acetylglucosamine transferase (SPINDLY family)/2-polyprenyl-3-methyl-5-hydroxy-6-metoxy-1,4-benzoquinol methylase
MNDSFSPENFINRVNALLAVGERWQALELCNQLNEKFPDSLEVKSYYSWILGAVDASNKEQQKALKVARSVLKQCPDQSRFRFRLGTILDNMQQTEQAIIVYQEGVKLDPSDDYLFMRLIVLSGSSYKSVIKQWDELQPERQRLLLILALQDMRIMGHIDEFDQLTTHLHKENINDAEIDAIQLYQNANNPEYEEAKLQHDYREWWNQYYAIHKRERPSLPPLDEQGRMVVAYVGRYLHYMFIQQHFPHHDLRHYQVLLITDDTRIDLSKTIPGITIIPFSGTDIAEECRKRGVHIAVDMCGPFGGKDSGSNLEQFNLFVQRIAPIQCGWITSLASMSGGLDWLISDAGLIPPEADVFYNERIGRISETSYCWSPAFGAPESNQLPALDHGYLTFGSTNRGAKLNDFTLDLWAKTMAACKNSRLVMIGHHCTSKRFRNRIKNIFSAHGIMMNRVQFLPYNPSSNLGFWTNFHAIDILLDSYPFNGGITTIESLWMGVPVLTMTGHSIGARYARTYLDVLGMARQWSCDTPEDFVKFAVAWDSQREQLGKIRKNLRQRLLDSAICNGVQFARKLEDLFLQMFREEWWNEERNPLPTEDELKKTVTNLYTLPPWKIMQGAAHDVLSTKVRDHVLHGLIDLIPSSPSLVLDVGCAYGANGRYIKQKFPDVTVIGIEPYKFAAKTAAERLDRVFCNRFEELDFDTNDIAPHSIDVVIFSDVLEHMFDPWSVLTKVKRYLRPDGYVLVSIPNVRWLPGVKRLINEGEWRYEHEGVFDQTHIRFFTLSSLMRLFSDTGYTQAKLRYALEPELRSMLSGKSEGGSYSLKMGRITMEDVTYSELMEFCTRQYYVLMSPINSAG